MTIIGILLIVIAIGLFVFAYFQMKGKWIQQDKNMTSPTWGKWIPAANGPWYKLWSVVFGAILLAAGIYIVCAVYSDYRPMKQKDIDRWERQKKSEGL